MDGADGGVSGGFMNLAVAQLSACQGWPLRDLLCILTRRRLESPRGSAPECVYNTPDSGDDSWMFDRYSAR